MGVAVEFERNPWLLVPIIVATVEAWGMTKAFVRGQVERRRERLTSAD